MYNAIESVEFTRSCSCFFKQFLIDPSIDVQYNHHCFLSCFGCMVNKTCYNELAFPFQFFMLLDT